MDPADGHRHRARRYWDGWLIRTCECGFETIDEDEYFAHMRRTGHKPAKEEK